MNLWTVLTTGHLDRQPVRAGEVSKFLVPLITLIVMSMVISSCGMPTEAYLYAPVRRTVDFDSGIMNFENSTENDADIFLGYMLFYRFYLSGNLPAGTGDTDAWDDLGEAFFTTSVLNTYDKENERGYYSTANNYSLFKILEIPMGNRGDAFIVTLDFSDLGGVNTFGNLLGSDFDLRRSFQREELGDDKWIEEITVGGERIFFSEILQDYDITDSDLPPGITEPLAAKELVCSVWTVAYGFDIYDTFQNVYSKPVYLGNFMFTIN